MIRAYDLQPDGTVRNMKVHYNFYPGRSADGMSIAAALSITTDSVEYRATRAAAARSPVALSTVANRSGIASTAIRIPIPSTGRPIAGRAA